MWIIDICNEQKCYLSVTTILYWNRSQNALSCDLVYFCAGSSFQWESEGTSFWEQRTNGLISVYL